MTRPMVPLIGSFVRFRNEEVKFEVEGLFRG